MNTLRKLNKAFQTLQSLGLSMPIITPQMIAWATAKAIEEDKIRRKQLFEELGANPDGSTRNVSTDVPTISGERLITYLEQLSKQSAKYRDKARRTKRRKSKNKTSS